MGTFSLWHWVIILIVVVLLFGGRGKISRLMADVGRGLKSFKRNVQDDGDIAGTNTPKAKVLDGSSSPSRDREDSR